MVESSSYKVIAKRALIIGCPGIKSKPGYLASVRDDVAIMQNFLSSQRFETKTLYEADATEDNIDTWLLNQ